jgi:hypothetical protein
MAETKKKPETPLHDGYDLGDRPVHERTAFDERMNRRLEEDRRRLKEDAKKD